MGSSCLRALAPPPSPACSATGGEPAALTKLDASQTRRRLTDWPSSCPMVAASMCLAQPGNSVRVGSLDSPDTRTLLRTDSKAHVRRSRLPAVRTGSNRLMAQPFDPSRDSS